MLDLIAKKRDGVEHSPEEIASIARWAASGEVPDYQLSAWLMAVRLNGMTRAETTAFTRAMASSGRHLDLHSRSGPLSGKVCAVDKHSTGGVGDGISIALAPLLAAAGLVVPMMSGRGLGHTGGTLDKLEAIRGFRVRMDIPKVGRILKKTGVCMFGQSGDLAPSDRKLYALRDATATVESRPLIVASILSKKLSEDLDALVLDVKCGCGAFFRSAAQARALASDLVRTADGLGLRCAALLTAMEEPLGRAVGNGVEVRQAVEILRGDFSAGDYAEVLFALGGKLMVLGRKAKHAREGALRLEALVRSGAALSKFKDMVRAHGGDPRTADDPERFLPVARLHREIRASKTGFLKRMDALLVGRAAVLLGAGRSRQEDAVDAGAGFLLKRKVGDAVRRGEIVAEAYASDADRLAQGVKLFSESLDVGTVRPRRRPVIISEIS
jgi:pyrimidine-nucleoside phosphorylase